MPKRKSKTIKKRKKVTPSLESNLKKEIKKIEQTKDVCVPVDKKTEELEKTRKALMNMLEDVEEARKKAEEEKDKTASIVNNLSDGLIVFNEKGRVILINPQTEKFLQLSSGDLLTKSIDELAIIPNVRPLARILGSETKGIFRKEITLRKNLTLEISTIPMIIGGVEFGNLVILHDITREKTIERMKTEFVSLAAHQLRTPLAAIKWTIKMLLDGDLGKINEDQREIIQKTYDSNERMINLINDLLDVTRIEEGRYLYKPVLADLKEIAGFVVKSHEDDIKRKGLKLNFNKPTDKIPRVMMDVEKIRLVVQNLIENAVKYTPTGGQINIYLKANEKEIELQVQDTGVGIPEDQQARIFTKFFRGANVMRMETEGSGLGIFISKNIVEAHGGKMWFDSEENKGTTFHFSLPIKKEFEEFLKEF